LLESKFARGYLYSTRKGVESGDIQAALEVYVRRKDLPKGVNALLEHWGFFRTIDIIKHVIVLIFSNPLIANTL